MTEPRGYTIRLVLQKECVPYNPILGALHFFVHFWRSTHGIIVDICHCAEEASLRETLACVPGQNASQSSIRIPFRLQL